MLSVLADGLVRPLQQGETCLRTGRNQALRVLMSSAAERKVVGWLCSTVAPSLVGGQEPVVKPKARATASRLRDVAPGLYLALDSIEQERHSHAGENPQARALPGPLTLSVGVGMLATWSQQPPMTAGWSCAGRQQRQEEAGSWLSSTALVLSTVVWLTRGCKSSQTLSPPGGAGPCQIPVGTSEPSGLSLSPGLGEHRLAPQLGIGVLGRAA